MDDARTPPDRSITRPQLELVIRRAVELYAAQTDADERLSEDEVLRIGKELGLPAAIVRQAIYEAPAPAAESIVDRWFGAAAVSVSRAVQLPEGDVASRLEEYLATREYLVLRRRQHSLTIFEPAEDTISKMARALSRPARSWYLARSRQVVLAVRNLEEGRTHVRIDMDLGNRRRETVAEGLVGAGAVGLAVGAIAGVSVGFGLVDVLGQTAAAAAGALAGLGGLTGGFTAIVAAVGKNFRRRLDAARLEVEGLLDRLERGERLEPPPAPWRRRFGIATSSSHRR